MNFKTLFVAAAFVAAPSLVLAQVGHDPDHSPYEDTEGHIDMSLMTGYWSAAHDPADVGPHSGPIIGFRYSAIFAATPVFVSGEFMHVFDDRQVINPTLPHSDRIVDPSPRSASMNIMDAKVGMQLTGQKTFHGFAPVISAGPGLVTDFGGLGGPGGYHFGTQIALVYGGGLRWVPSNKLLFRGDVNAVMFPHRYPQTYKTVTADGTSVIGTTASLSAWRTNGAFTLGAWYALFR